MNQHTHYDEDEKLELLEDLIEALSAGTPLREFARQRDVAYASLYRWAKAAGEDMQTRIAHAREVGGEALAEECLDIADGWGDPARDKLRVWTRLQLLAKWFPERYGERQRLDHAGVKDQPITIVTGVPQVEPKEDFGDLSAFE